MRVILGVLLLVCGPASGVRSAESSRVLRASAPAPYPASRVVGGIVIDWSTHQRGAPGSDNFMMTWADDGHQYGVWGDGGGFGGDNKKYRVFFGVARIEGTHDAFRPFNRFGHRDNSEHEAVFTGKSWGMVSVNRVLYTWVHPDPPHSFGGTWPWVFREARLYSSADHGARWEVSTWSFAAQDGLLGGNILQFGRDYAGARDNYIYHYMVEAMQPDASNGELQSPGKIILLRVPKHRMLAREDYEVYAGLDGAEPRWSKKLSDRRPVFEDANGLGTPIGISYNPGLQRYMLCTENSEPHVGNWGMFEAPEPWGPWFTVVYLTKSRGTWFGENNDGPHDVPPNTFFWHFRRSGWMRPGATSA